jgi:alpha-galactosidase
MNHILDILKNANAWSAPEIGLEISHGDMPGDKVEINQDHINKSKIVFVELLKKLPMVFESSKSNRAVVTVCGGSGVGKSEIASLLSYYLNQLGIGSYTLSGDNYPRRIPKYNDAERLRIFRQSGVKALVEAERMNSVIYAELRELQEKDDDANKAYVDKYPWFNTYLNGAIDGLKGYLGTKNEINFDEVTDIVKQFKAGANDIWLKRMGRTESELWYDKVDFSQISVLVIEWTHGNSDNYEGVDIPVLLNSTPEETLAHRRSRNRDGKTDSAFTMRVLEIEQQMLDTQAHKAKIIISKPGELLSYDEYKTLMVASK